MTAIRPARALVVTEAVAAVSCAVRRTRLAAGVAGADAAPSGSGSSDSEPLSDDDKSVSLGYPQPPQQPALQDAAVIVVAVVPTTLQPVCTEEAVENVEVAVVDELVSTP